MNPALSPVLCRARQQRLLDLLEDKRLGGALLTDARHIHYFCGFWTPAITPAALWISRAGETVLSAAIAPQTAIAADSVELYQADVLATLVDDLSAASLQPLQEWLRGATFGCEALPASLEGGAYEIIGPHLLKMRRTKDADEVALIRHAIFAAERLYQRASEILRPGAGEVEIYAELTASAIRAAGEPLGELGNNFQCNGPGGAPRWRAIEAGELWPLDISVNYRGYRCDLCRTFCIGDAPTPAQSLAHGRVRELLLWFEDNARAGSSCRDLYQRVWEQLDGFEGWQFPHHLGHGIGLSPHEAPRLNPAWDDYLRVGDVIAVEPGLYGAELRNGVRLEDDYLVTEAGLEKLSIANLDLNSQEEGF